MARRKNQPDAVRAKCRLAERLRQVRVDLFGERGGSEMARRLGLPVRTWYNYEAGVTVPAEVLLRFVELTSVEPTWLLHGRGPCYRPAPASDVEGDSVQSLLRAALRRLEEDVTPVPYPSLHLSSGDSGSDGMLKDEASWPRRNTTLVAADGEWLAARRDLRCVRVEGNAMAPVAGDGAVVAYADSDDDPATLDGKLVVAWVDDRPLVRWLSLSGRMAVLRSENSSAEPSTHLIDLDGASHTRKIRRVLGVSTPH